MKIYIDQKIFSWTDKFYVKDKDGNDIYSVEGEILSLGKRLHIHNTQSEEVAFLKQKLWSFLPRFELFIGDKKEAEVIKKFTFLIPKYIVEGPNWEVTGDFWAYNYEITKDKEIVAKISKKFFSWSDSYEIDIKDSENEILALAIVLAIDADLQTRHNNSSD